jgi:hypothetical protein
MMTRAAVPAMRARNLAVAPKVRCILSPSTSLRKAKRITKPDGI